MSWFDSHCHLHICEEEQSVEDVLERAADHGVDRILTVGIDVASSKRSLELTSHEGVVASAGVHPNSADEWTPDAAEAIADLLGDERVRAVGETGLDFYRDWVKPDVQRKAFRDHIALAKRFGKALVIHTRDSMTATLDELDAAGAPDRVVFHCWSGTRDELDRALALGAYVSFAGNVSFKSAGDLRSVAAHVPKDRLLVETDSPYLSPVPFRGKANEPARVAYVGEAVAAARDEEVAEVRVATTRNATTLFLS